MGQINELPNGVRIELLEDGFVVVSKTGERTEFDIDGNRIKSIKNFSPDWMEYFFTIGKEERKVIANWYWQQKCRTKVQRNFLSVVGKALQEVNYDYKIACIEPSIDEQGKLFYKKYSQVCVGLRCREWVGLAEKFAIELGSRLANIHELFLWYAYRIAKGYWSIEYVTEYSSSEGNYWHAPNASKELEPSGLRLVGGEKDGVGNSYKIVRMDNGFALCGGCFALEGLYYPVADIKYYEDYESFCDYGSGVIVLNNF